MVLRIKLLHCGHFIADPGDYLRVGMVSACGYGCMTPQVVICEALSTSEFLKADEYYPLAEKP